MSELYEKMLEEFGSADNFIEELCRKNGIDTEDEKPLLEVQRLPCKTIDDMLVELQYWKGVLGGDALVNIDDSSGYSSDVTGCYEDSGVLVLK